MRWLIVLAVLAAIFVSTTGAANYMYEKASVKGVGYKNVEMIVSTQEGFNGAKLVEKESGSGNVITERTELEAERQLQPSGETTSYGQNILVPFACSTGCAQDYINFTKEAEFEYMPVSYQTGTYDQKWIEKLCVQNYKIGAVLTEMYTHAEHLQKNTEVKTRYAGWDPAINTPDKVLFGSGQHFWAPDGFDPKHPDYKMTSATPTNGWNEYVVTDGFDCSPSKPVIIPGTHDTAKEANCAACCTGVLEANLNSNVIGVAHIGWISRDPAVNIKGRHNEWGRSVEDLTGVFSIEKFIQLWGNSTCGAISVDWLPCV